MSSVGSDDLARPSEEHDETEGALSKFHTLANLRMSAGFFEVSIGEEAAATQSLLGLLKFRSAIGEVDTLLLRG